MELIRGQRHLRPRHRGCVATIGNFDGVHLGHQAIIAQLTEQAVRLHLPRVVITFEPQPQEFFAGPTAPPARLMRLREKLLALDGLGIERTLCLTFDRALAALPAERFIEDLLVQHLGIRYLVVGDDFRFGHRRAGDFAMLVAAGQCHGFEVADTRSCILDGERISSTRIRQTLSLGDLELATRLLGRPYDMCGRVAYGDQVGRTIGFPTANIHLHRRVTPVYGVYAVMMSGPGLRPWPGIANVGRRPTVQGNRERLEVHLLDFQGDLYGRHVKVDFLHYLRPEQRFESLAALQAQIQQDERAARTYFSARGLL
ncbi:MAG TPA: bifunctional riboflavin kinase/FAD synthetase [Candidatus Competibacteraceae bacterium]|nr:MAG: bifunctional riboflavin kinase/FAD synthetase [Candidatus Competibacteraceae bacterium]HOB63469.1 bifunctional riboflavin kinase/FAD synthetase [Candidatus Competibacteraceae bacterium]HQA25408.1 bifunctional riboflavin kinase/FAD synthetase [Candidatus Competibacteraceae bacterium]HQD57870.1 bifunctional riboflavin kinase/FAD synthetase [Candidatus Competibacteraceae bacterium]